MFDKVKPGRTRTFDTGYAIIEVRGDDDSNDSSKDTSDDNN